MSDLTGSLIDADNAAHPFVSRDNPGNGTVSDTAIINTCKNSHTALASGGLYPSGNGKVTHLGSFSDIAEQPHVGTGRLNPQIGYFMSAPIKNTAEAGNYPVKAFRQYNIPIQHHIFIQ